MRRFHLSLACLVLLTPLLCRASEFDWMARNVERESGCKQTHIPLFGLVRFAVGMTHPAGTTQLNLAIFENPAMPAEQFHTILRETAGSAWKPMIRVRSRNDSTAIYAQGDGKHVRLLIGTVNQQDATLVQVRLNVRDLMHFIENEERH